MADVDGYGDGYGPMVPHRLRRDCPGALGFGSSAVRFVVYSMRCGICRGVKRYDGFYKIMWCEVCDLDIPGLTAGRPSQETIDAMDEALDDHEEEE